MWIWVGGVGVGVSVGVGRLARGVWGWPEVGGVLV